MSHSDAKERVRQASQRCASTDKAAIAEEEKHGKPDAPLGFSMVPIRQTKVIYFVRHGQGYHNVAGHADIKNYLSWDYEDANLTDFGWQQAAALKKHISSQPEIKPEVVIVSPMTRAIETAIGAFGGSEWSSSDSASPLMREQTAVEGKVAAHKAVSSAGCPPFVSWEGCREHLGKHPCDRRRPVDHYRKLYPGIDFSLVEEGDDKLWTPEAREEGPAIKARGLKFTQWLMQRPEQRIAVVSHSSFLFFLSSNFGRDCGESALGELHRWYENCELRTCVLSDTQQDATSSDATWFQGGKNIVSA